MKWVLGGFLALPLSVLAAEPVTSAATAVAPVAGSSLGGQLTQLV
ncbi:flagellar assembly protein FliO, partial [Pseudomonas sp. CCC2.2]|nr:flagellar assembly protein FliO [Pseudomonas sp. CCC2.2]